MRHYIYICIYIYIYIFIYIYIYEALKNALLCRRMHGILCTGAQAGSRAVPAISASQVSKGGGEQKLL
jgi:hypothetical protein